MIYERLPRIEWIVPRWAREHERREDRGRAETKRASTGSSLPRATGFAYSPLHLTRWRIYIMHPLAVLAGHGASATVPAHKQKSYMHAATHTGNRNVLQPCRWIHVYHVPLRYRGRSLLIFVPRCPFLADPNRRRSRSGDSSSEFASVESVAWAVRLLSLPNPPLSPCRVASKPSSPSGRLLLFQRWNRHEFYVAP